MYCKNCGKEIDSSAAFCPYCGEKLQEEIQDIGDSSTLRCPKCGSSSIDVQLHQENQESKTVSKTKSKYHQKGHGCLWWLFIGWWWWIIDLALWICIFPIRFLVQLFKKKKYVGESTTDSFTKNKVSYKTVYLCKSCGHHWE